MRRVYLRGGPADGKVVDLENDVAGLTVKGRITYGGFTSYTYQSTGRFDDSGLEIWEVPNYHSH